MIELTIDGTAFTTTPTPYPEPWRVAPLMLAASRSIAKGANEADLGSRQPDRQSPRSPGSLSGHDSAFATAADRSAGA
jgi:hypothetical protein